MSRVLDYPGLADFNERIKEAMKPIIYDAYDEGYNDGYENGRNMKKEELKKALDGACSEPTDKMTAFAQGFCDGRDTMWEIARYITTEMTMDQIAEVFGEDISLVDIFNIESYKVLEKISAYQDGTDEEDIDDEFDDEED